MRKSIVINAPVSEVFAYLTHPQNLPEIWPSLVEVSNVQANPRGGYNYDWIYKMAGMRFHGHSEVIEFQPNRLSVVKNEKGIRSTFHWSFQGQDDTTLFTSEVDYDVPGSLFAKLAAPFIHKVNEREADIFMANLKARMEEGTRVHAETQPHA
ncbi:MAG: SRPBCC family protein [Polyangia bacterium]